MNSKNRKISQNLGGSHFIFGFLVNDSYKPPPPPGKPYGNSIHPLQQLKSPLPNETQQNCQTSIFNGKVTFQSDEKQHQES